MSTFHGIPDPNHVWTILGLHDAVEVTITREAVGSYNAAGRFEDGASSTSTTEAVVYPASGKETQLLDEARRTNETLVAFTTAALRTAKAGSSGYPSDVLSDLPSPWDADEWEVVRVQAWPGRRFGYEALLQKVGQ